MNPPSSRVEVLVAGYGPVGAVLAARLGAHGLHTLVVERDPALFALPRAVAADDEVQLLLSRVAPGLVEPMLPEPGVRFVDRTGRLLGRVTFPPSPYGRPALAFFRQPVLEATLRAHVAALSPVEVRLGTALETWTQDGGGVHARLSDGSQVRADWLVGCDGAASAVRRAAGIAWRGRELPHRWLVADVAGEVPGRSGFTYTCDPARPQVDMPVPGGHRWEWLLRDAGPLADPGAAAGALLARDAGDRRLERAVTYRYGARRAAAWRSGRVLLAGDAAHTMPPFAGQGLGAGVRDAWLLAELLAAGDPAGYQELRAPHVRQMTRLSLLLGALLQAEHLPATRDALLRGAFRSPLLGRWLSTGGPRRRPSGLARRLPDAGPSRPLRPGAGG